MSKIILIKYESIIKSPQESTISVYSEQPKLIKVYQADLLKYFFSLYSLDKAVIFQFKI